MSTEILVPFSLTPGGGILVTQDPNVQINQHLISLVGTQPGERVMQPTYGVETGDYVFSPQDETVSTQLVNDVSSAINAWEPSVIVQSIIPQSDSANFGSVNVKVEFAQGAVALFSQTQTATILVGGTVVSDNT